MKISAYRTLDTVTPQDWRNATVSERSDFIEGWAHRGIVSFGCMRCHYPLAHGGDACPACEGSGLADRPFVRPDGVVFADCGARVVMTLPTRYQ